MQCLLLCNRHDSDQLAADMAASQMLSAVQWNVYCCRRHCCCCGCCCRWCARCPCSNTLLLFKVCAARRQMGKTLFMDENLAVPFVSSSAADSALPSKVKSLRPHSGTCCFESLYPPVTCLSGLTYAAIPPMATCWVDVLHQAGHMTELCCLSICLH